MIKEIFNDIKKGQKNFGEDVQTILNFFMLTLVYFIGVGLTSIFAKILGKHFLNLKICKDTRTYWEDIDQKDRELNKYYRQF